MVFVLEVEDIKFVAYFDQVEKEALRMKRRALGHAGGTVRRIARRSIKKAPMKEYSNRAGEPPLYHVESHRASIRNILYDVAPDGSTVVVGPVKKLDGDIPRALEHGGTTIVRRRNKYGKVTTVKRVLKPRPFMGPALAIFEDKYADQFRSVLGKR